MRKRRLAALDAQVKKHCYRKREVITRIVYLHIRFANLFYVFYDLFFFFKGEASKRPRRDGNDDNDDSNDSGTVITQFLIQIDTVKSTAISRYIINNNQINDESNSSLFASIKGKTCVTVTIDSLKKEIDLI